MRGAGSGFTGGFENMMDQSLGKCAKAPETQFCSKLKPRPCVPVRRDIEAL